MKPGSAAKFVLVLCFTAGYLTAEAQSQLKPERFRLLSDRPLYVAGETVAVNAMELGRDPLRPDGWSRLFYLELVSREGISLRRAKFPLGSAGASGSLEIPGDLPSGTYFLKGYTRWMRNFGPGCYAYLGIEVVNPYRRERLPADSSVAGPDMAEWDKKGGISPILVSGIPEQLPVRSEFRMSANMKPGTGTFTGCISVTRKGIPGAQFEPVPSPEPFTDRRVAHIPEIHGPSLSGRVIRAGTGEPVPYSKVYVTVMDGSREFHCNYADSTGRFFFAFPSQSGRKELFISAYHQDVPSLEMNIEHDFCTEKVDLPALPLTIESDDRALLSEMAVNAQICEQYHSGTRDVHSSDDTLAAQKRPGRFFYGEPHSVIRFADYIRLPTLEEYFTELIPEVALQRNRRNKSFRVLGDHPDLTFHDPLVMVDGVAVFDHESVLEISPRLVERVEIVHAPYIRGPLTFGGILHVITREGNLGFMELPDSGLLIEYRMVRSKGTEAALCSSPGDPGAYDARNTLYWDPEFTLNGNETASVSFTTGHTRGAYRILLRGYTGEGHYVSQSWDFEVR